MCVNDTLSDECLIETRVTQRSKLGSILFFTYKIEFHYVPENLGVFFTIVPQMTPKIISVLRHY